MWIHTKVKQKILIEYSKKKASKGHYEHITPILLLHPFLIFVLIQHILQHHQS